MKSKIVRAAICLVLIGTMMATQAGAVAGYDWGDLWDDASDTAGDLWDDASDTAGDLWDDVSDTAGDLWDDASDTAGDLWDDVSDTADDLWDDASDTASDLWNDITDEYREHFGGWGQQAGDLIDQMPREAKEWLVESVDEATTIVMPIPAVAPGAPVSFAKISLVRGTVEIYEPSTEEVITVLTDKALGYVSGGKVNVERIEELSVKEIGDQKYRTSIDAEMKLLGFIPITVEYEATVKVDENEGIQVLDADRPWWNIFVL